MIALAGDVRLFQHHHLTPGQERGKHQNDQKTEINNPPRIATLMQPLQKSLSYNKGIALHTHSLITALYPKPEIKTPGKAGRYVIKPCPAGAARPPAEAHLHGMLPA